MMEETRPPGGTGIREFVIAVIVVGSLFLPSAPVAAQESDDETEIALAEVPSTGARRPGPVLVASVAARAPASVPDLEAEATPAPDGVAPVEFVIDDLGIAAPIEQGSIVDGAMQDPAGPWVVTWYD